MVIYYDSTDRQVVGFYENCDGDTVGRVSVGQVRLEVPIAHEAQARALTTGARVILDSDGLLIGLAPSPNLRELADLSEKAAEGVRIQDLRASIRVKLTWLDLTDDELALLL